MKTLSDTQAILLSTASTRHDGRLLPLAASLKPGGGVSKALDALLNNGLAKERQTNDTAAVRRTEDDVRYGVFITAAGSTAIGVDAALNANAGGDDTVQEPPASTRVNKSTLVLDLLRRPGGAALTSGDELKHRNGLGGLALDLRGIRRR